MLQAEEAPYTYHTSMEHVVYIEERAKPEPGGEPTPITSIDDIDPEECNFVHNINACFVGGVAPEGVFDQGDFIGLFLRAQHDLAARLAIDPKIVKIASVEAVEWPDASLGVPEEGMTYAQVITPGFELVLQAGEAQYTYHTSMEHVVYVEGEEAAGMELSEADEVDLVRLSLEWGLVEKNVPDYGLLSDPQNIVLVLEGFETRIVPKLVGVNLTLLSTEEAQAKADAEGDFPYLRISLYQATEATAQVEVATTMAVSKDSEIGYLVGGGCRLTAVKADGEWKLNVGEGAVMMCWIA